MLKFLLVVLLIAVCIYLLIRGVQRRGGTGAVLRLPGSRGGGGGRRTIAPDDDEQFLRDLDRWRREQGEPPV